MTFWKVDKYYRCPDCTLTYAAVPYNWPFRRYMAWYGIKGLKGCYLFKKQAEKKATLLNKRVISHTEQPSSDAALALCFCFYLAKYIKQGTICVTKEKE